MMKKLMTAACLLLLAAGAGAQNEVGTWSVKPYAGVGPATMANMPNIPLTDDIALKKDFLPGFVAGAEAEYQLTETFSLSAGLDFAMQGGKWKDFERMNVQVKNTKLQLGYIQLPLMANWYVGEGLSLKAGVQFGMMVHAHLKSYISGTVDGKPYHEDVDERVMDDFHRLDISIPFGLSYEFDNHLVLEARYKLGLTLVDKSDEDSRGSMRNRVFTISFGYKFQL